MSSNQFFETQHPMLSTALRNTHILVNYTLYKLTTSIVNEFFKEISKEISHFVAEEGVGAIKNLLFTVPTEQNTLMCDAEVDTTGNYISMYDE